MIPFKDENPIRRFPLITITFISINTIIFLLQVFSPAGMVMTAYAYGAIPTFLLGLQHAQPIHPFLTVFTSMFMHGSLLHLGSNMLYLWIFGNNIEDKLGYARFILFYLLCGVIAAYSHAIADPKSLTPMIGASGAVSGVLGAYLLLFPRAKIHTLIFLGFFVQVIRLPAIIVIGLWIVIQFVNGLVSKGLAGQGGVAWFAHIGGFIAGFLIISLFLKSRKKQAFF